MICMYYFSYDFVWSDGSICDRICTTSCLGRANFILSPSRKRNSFSLYLAASDGVADGFFCGMYYRNIESNAVIRGFPVA